MQINSGSIRRRVRLVPAHLSGARKAEAMAYANAGSSRRSARLVPANPFGVGKEALMPASNCGSTRRSVQLVAAPTKSSKKISNKKRLKTVSSK